MRFLGRQLKVPIAWLTAATVGCFNNWALAFIFNRRLIAKGADISDLSALTQPHHNLFRTLDVVAGSLLALTGVILMRRSKKSVWVILTVLGLANILDAVTALKCTAVADIGCFMPTKLNWQHPVLPSHIFSSTVIIGAMILLYIVTLESKRLKLVSLIGLSTTAVFFDLFILFSYFYAKIFNIFLGHNPGYTDA